MRRLLAAGALLAAAVAPPTLVVGAFALATVGLLGVVVLAGRVA